MKLAIGSDHGGYDLKEAIKNYFSEKKIEIIDIGTDNKNISVDYPDYAKCVVKMILEKKCEAGILICGTGIGMSIAANRYKGIRAALCTDEFMAEMSRKHNNSNILILGGRVLTPPRALKIVEIWLETDFEGGRHITRLNKIEESEC